MIAKVILGTMNNARKLVSIVEKIPYDAELCSGRYVVNAKSMLGVLSMPEFEVGELHIHTDEEIECSNILELNGIRPVLEFVGTPFVALIIAVLCAMYFLGKKQGYNVEQLKKILDRSLRPTGQILLVITGGGIIRWVLQDCGMGDIIGPALEKSGLPLILVAFLIAALVRASVGAAVVLSLIHI